MENLQHGNFRYELFVTRFQEIKPTSYNNILFKTLQYIASCEATSTASTTIALASCEADTSQFASTVSAYEQECRRVALFYRSQHQQLWNALLELVGHLRSRADYFQDPPSLLGPGSNTPGRIIEKLTTLRALLDALGEKIVALDAFAKANIEAAAELALVGDGKKENSPTVSSSTMVNSSMVPTGDIDHVEREYSKAAEAAMLGVLRLDPIILGLSDAYALLNIIEESEAEGKAAAAAAAAVASTINTTTNKSHSSSSSSFARWVAPQKFKRTTKKFWLKLSDATLFKTEVIKHLPILVYGNRRKITEIDPSDLLFTLPPLSESDASPISSVYLDSLPAGLPSYHSRLRRQDGATAVRLRWYGERNPEDPFQQIFVEKKVHVVGRNQTETALATPAPAATAINGGGGGGGGGSGEDSKQQQQQQLLEGQKESEKQRVALPQSQIPALLSGHPVAVPKNFSQEDFDFLQQVQMYILDDSHATVLRTCYSRTAFQHDSHNRVRISMDTDLRMVRDYIPEQTSTISGGGPLSSRGNGLHSLQWCRSDADIANASAMDTFHFPYAVIEVKLQVNPPEWLQNLVRKEILLPVPKFSKFLHGTALLYQNYVENVPRWFLPNPNFKPLTNKRRKYVESLDYEQQKQLQQQEQRQLSHLQMTPATWVEMIAPSAELVSDAALWLFPASNVADVGGVEAEISRQKINEEGEGEAEEEEVVEQSAPPRGKGVGLFSRWRRSSSKRGASNGISSSTSITATPTTDRNTVLPINGTTTTAATTPVTVHQVLPSAATPTTTTPTNTATTSSPIAGSVNGEKYEAPGTPDGASPRAGEVIAPGTLQNQMMMQIMMNTDDSSGPSSIGTSNPSTRRGGSGGSGEQRCPSSPTSSSSVSSLVSSAEGVGHHHKSDGGSGGGGSQSPVGGQDQFNYGLKQEQHSPQGVTPSWQVFQEPPLSPSPVPMISTTAAAAVGGAAAAATPMMEFNGNAVVDLESGDGARSSALNSGSTTISSLSPLVLLPGAALGVETAAGAAAEKPASRKSSLVHLVSSIPGLGALTTSHNNNNNTNNITNNIASSEKQAKAAEAGVERKNSFRSVYPMNSMSMSPTVTEEDEKKEPPLLPSYSLISSPSGHPRGTAGGPPRAMVRTRVEPKTFFANERTFLQWLQISVLVMFLGLNLLNGSMLLPGASSSSSSSSSGICASNDSKCIASKISGALIAPVALLFMAYSLFMYRQRTRQILRRESVRYDDQRGPAILVAILLTVMLISYVIAMIYVF